MKQVAVKPATVIATKTVAVSRPAGASALPANPPASSAPPSPPAVSADLLKRISDNLQKMGDKRPGKPSSLRRALKSLLGAETGHESIEVALGKLIAAGVVAIDASSGVTYPRFTS